MKKILILLLFAMLPYSLFSQNAFLKYYGTTSTYQVGEQIVVTNDGQFVVAGIDQTDNYEQGNFFLTKSSADGTLIWHKVLHTPQLYSSLKSLTKTTDGGYIIGGGRRATPFDVEIAVIVKTDAAGNVQWTKTYGTGNVSDIEPLSGGGYVVALDLVDMGLVANTIAKVGATGEVIWKTDTIFFTIEKLLVTTEGKSLFIHGGTAVMLNADGSTDWEVYFAAPGSYSSAKNAIQLNNGQLLLLHSANNGDILTWMDTDGNVLSNKLISANVQPTPREIVELSNDKLVLLSRRNLARYDKMGNLLQETAFGELSLADATNGLDIALTSNDDLAITGISLNSDSGYDPFIARISSSLNVNWLMVTGNNLPSAHETAQACVQTPDGGFVIAGRRSYANLKTDFYLFKTDAQGNVNWEANYGGLEEDFLYSMTHLTDGGFLLTGLRVNYASSAFHLLLVKADANGNLAWEKSYDYSDEIPLGDFVAQEWPNGDLAIVFQVYTGKGSKPIYMRTNSLGDSLITKPLDLGTAYYDAKISNDGYLLLTGYAPDGSYALVNKIDMNGNSAFLTTIEPGNAQFGQGLDMEVTPDGGILVLSDVRFNYRDTVALSKLDINGNVEWSKIYSPSENSNGNEVYSPHLVKTIDGNYLMPILSFNEYDQPDGNLLYFIKVDEQGNELWRKPLENEVYDEVINDAISISDGGYLLTGYGHNYKHNDKDILLVKTLGDGTVGTFQPIIPLGEMDLSPNPSSGALAVKFQSDYTGPMSIEIIQSSSGQLLRQFATFKNSGLWSENYYLPYLPVGTYSVRLTANGRSLVKTWMKQ